MPIIKSREVVALYVHVPKSGGSSIAKLLREAGASISFLDREFDRNKSVEENWSVTSPQHCPGGALDQLFDSDFFDFSCAVVRNPVLRLQSAFLFQKYIKKTIPRSLSLDQFVCKILSSENLVHSFYDNHFLPQVSFFPTTIETKIFHYENSLEPVKKYLEESLRVKMGSVDSVHMNRSDRLLLDNIDFDLSLSNESVEIIKKLYEKDFSSFGYEDLEPTTDACMFRMKSNSKMVRKTIAAFFKLWIPPIVISGLKRVGIIPRS